MARHIRCFSGIFALAIALVSHGYAYAEAAKPAERGVVVAESINLKGKVISVDAETRTVTLEGPMGRQIEILAPKDAPNFDQIKVGDPVAATYVESIALSIAPVKDAQSDVSETVVVATAPKGATPAATVAEQIEIRAVVKAVDTENRKVTLEVPGGNERTIKVGQDVDVEKIRVGEQVTVALTRALAISIDKE